MPNRVMFFEIGCKDRAKTTEFYRSLFQWDMKPDANATEITTAAANSINGHIVSLGHEPHQYTIFYVEVEDVAASLAKAKELGGRTVVPPVKIPAGTFAWMRDPEGNVIGLLQPPAPKAD